jgi:hypothetical protein
VAVSVPARGGRPSENRLREAEARIAREVAGPLHSLAPDRELATPLRSVHARALEQLPASRVDAVEPALAEGLRALALAQLDAFPGNLLWDLDLIAVAIADEAGRCDAGEAVALVDDRFERMAGLQHLYGRATPINFSYVHDFVYGFDWAKWVAREPSLHADVPAPFSLRFLTYMDARGHELLELIAEDDAKYPRLSDAEPRNPFPFSREPADELALHRELARRDLIPVPTWNPDALDLDWGTRWRVPFQDRRVEVARELELTQA